MWHSQTVPDQMDSGTVVPAYKRNKHLTVAADDRPITPMKDRMIYDPRNSSLDFRDGESYFECYSMCINFLLKVLISNFQCN